LEEISATKGLRFTQRGVEKLTRSNHKGRNAKKTNIASEAAIYASLGMQYVPPELREDEGEVEAALAGRLPDDLITVDDIQGMTHCHTTYSDGKHSIEEMARAAEAMDMRYITISDHSPTASYAGGLTIDRLK